MTRKEFNQELDKLKKMNGKDRLWYIWAYYKIPILIFAAALFLLFQAAGAVRRSGQESMLYCVFLELPSVSEREAEALRKDFYEAMAFSGRQTVTLDASLSLTDPACRDASAIILQSLIATDTADVVITTRELLDEYCAQDVFLNLQDVLPEELLGLLSEELVCAATASGQSIPAGIRLENSLLPSYGLDEDAVLAVCSLENHPEVIADFLAFMFPQAASS